MDALALRAREPERRVIEPERAAPALTASLTPASLLALQRTAGNQAVESFIARQTAPSPVPAAAADEATEAEVLEWPKTLTEAKRGRTRS